MVRQGENTSRNILFRIFITLSFVSLILFSEGALASSCLGKNYQFSCGQVITESCTLDGDLTAETSCFEIGADSIVLDCAGHSITPQFYYIAPGIYSNNKKELTIKNCNLYFFSQGIALNNVSKSLIQNNQLNYNGDSGLTISAGEKNNFIGNTANHNTNIGFYIESSKKNNFIGNTANSNRRGFEVYLDSENTTLSGNTANSNVYQGIITECPETIIINNTVQGNLDGISASRGFSHYNTIEKNKVISNTEIGILLDESNHNSVKDNYVFGNPDGIYIFYGSSGNNITNNNISNNTGRGIYIGSGPNLLTNNSIIDDQYGIYLESSSNTINNNTINGSSEYDIYTTEGTTNTLTNTTIKGVKTNLVYADAIGIKSQPTPQSDPTGYANISKYLNITNFSSAWIYLNITYNDIDWQNARIVNESSLRIWRYNGTSWNNSNLGTSTSGVNTTANYVYANITNFGKFNVFGKLTCSDGTQYTSCSINRPLFCQNGQLINKCTVCGCRPLYQCNTSTNVCTRDIQPRQVAIKD